MRQIEWNEMNNVLNEKLNQIFQGNIPSDNNKKRKIIFDNIVDNTQYDFKLLKGIINRTASRDGVSEIMDPLKNGKGVCNGISYAYKMLLEKVGIYSMLIASNLKYDENEVIELKRENFNIKQNKEGTYVLQHMAVLVENEDKTYSFDDPTCAIINKSKRNLYYNYDLKMANENNQFDFLGFPADYMNALVGRQSNLKEKNIEKQYIDTENLCGFMRLPSKIKVYKEKIIDNEIDER